METVEGGAWLEEVDPWWCVCGGNILIPSYVCLSASWPCGVSSLLWFAIPPPQHSALCLEQWLPSGPKCETRKPSPAHSWFAQSLPQRPKLSTAYFEWNNSERCRKHIGYTSNLISFEFTHDSNVAGPQVLVLCLAFWETTGLQPAVDTR